MTITMAIGITTPTTSLLHSSSSSSSSSPTVGRASCLCSFSSLSISIPKNAIFHHVKCIPQLGFTPFPQWSGLKQMGFSILPSSLKTRKKGKSKGKGVYASLFGVGAPEVLVIGVVALLVFGPKGLAEVARNLGKTLRVFQPTIRELQEVSREFKSTLEREIGLDDIDNPTPKSSTSDTTKPKSVDAPADSETKIDPNGSSGNEEDSSDDHLKVRADSFLGVLAQLQKEQAEEEPQKIIENENDEIETSESQTPSQDDTPEALDDSREASSVTSTENPDNNALQEADSVTTTSSDDPKNNALQEAASMVPTGTATKTEIDT